MAHPPEPTEAPPPLEPPRLLRQRPLLQAQGLHRSYGPVTALADVSLAAYPGEVLGIVGESGSGKSTLLRLLNLQEPADRGYYALAIPGYSGQNLFALNRYQARQVRVQHIGIVYQNPHLGLRMKHTASGNVAERLVLAGERRFGRLRRAARGALAASEFPLERMDEAPIRLSGGMQQRVQLAKALALEPALLLLDEPTTGLDVSVQALVLDTLKRLQRARSITMLIVSHDLGVIRTLADRVLVMRAGRVVEQGLTDQVLEDPQHPYTQELVHAKL
ncbi:ATP-binding cassette domain-containing protein [Meiothermus sp. CFH 77666]|uniref:ATP-binding cassette domain-containing protein n=1 Tax=Meiothermus sp. CFH 77666 TaxID=2817942 RepID=UPI001AA0A690|nr:ATP-binding cassette domain-containing protein [Meiothermus sp. CFH 77666]MBO1438430.1 ATP-binding cassette domain-containing protein [Meiothermus sp. CFH 77666]